MESDKALPEAARLILSQRLLMANPAPASTTQAAEDSQFFDTGTQGGHTALLGGSLTALMPSTVQSSWTTTCHSIMTSSSTATTTTTSSSSNSTNHSHGSQHLELLSQPSSPLLSTQEPSPSSLSSSVSSLHEKSSNQENQPPHPQPSESTRKQLWTEVQLDRTNPRKWAVYLKCERAFHDLNSGGEKLRDLYAKAVKAMVHVDRDGNDPELISIWLEFIHLQRQCGATLDVCVKCFEHMKQLGIGSKNANFYIHWSKYLEKASGNTNGAKQLLQAALQNGVEDVKGHMKKRMTELEQGAKPALGVHSTPSSASRSNSLSKGRQPKRLGILGKAKRLPMNGELQALPEEASLESVPRTVEKPGPGSNFNESSHAGKNASMGVAATPAFKNSVAFADTPISIQQRPSAPASAIPLRSAPPSELKISPPNSIVRPQLPPETPLPPQVQPQLDLYHPDQITAVHLQTPLPNSNHRPQLVQSVPQHVNPSSAAAPRQQLPPPPMTPAGPPINIIENMFSNPKNMIMVNGKCYIRLELIGKGGSSKVFKVLAQDGKLYALKRVQLRGADPATVSSYLNEMDLLKRLSNSGWIIQLYDSEVNEDEGYIHMVMECGEIDLAGVLHKQNQTEQNVNFNFIRIHWEQMLRAVHAIHEERVVHSDLKPANFLFVRGILKLIDFGIAKAIQNDTTNIHREQQIGTVNYMSPEAIIDTNNSSRDGSGAHQQCMKLGRASDVWSLGCILYQMVYGKPPFSHMNMIQKLQAIINPHHQIQFPKVVNPFLMEVMQSCLQRDPKKRMTIPDLLRHPFLKIDQFIHDIQRSSLLNEALLESVVKRVLSQHQENPNSTSRQLTNDILSNFHRDFNIQ